MGSNGEGIWGISRDTQSSSNRKSLLMLVCFAAAALAALRFVLGDKLCAIGVVCSNGDGSWGIPTESHSELTSLILGSSCCIGCGKRLDCFKTYRSGNRGRELKQ